MLHHFECLSCDQSLFSQQHQLSQPKNIEEITQWHEDGIKFISSSRRVKLFFLLYRQKDIGKIIEGNYRNYVINKLTCEIMENKPLGSRR